METVRATRAASPEELVDLMLPRMQQLLRLGVTTCEVKSGYGLTVQDELKQLRVIRQVAKLQPIAMILTCLAAHTLPWEFPSPSAYLTYLMEELFPQLRNEDNATDRIDIFIEEGAFTIEEARPYLQAAKRHGFSLCLHVEQLTSGAASFAAEIGALSADHLEHLSLENCWKLEKAGVIAVVLPGASLGLGMPMAPARMMLDNGLAVAIASDWNPGSAPMGNLLMQAAVLGITEKLSTAEIFLGITARAAKALSLHDRGILKPGMRADFSLFPCDNFLEILYHQGSLLPAKMCVSGKLLST